MLALSRTEGQSIIIDGIIEIRVVKWSRNCVRLAIQAPREVSVDRDEIWKRVHPGEKSPMEKADSPQGNGAATSRAVATDQTHMGSPRPLARMEAAQVHGLVGRPTASKGIDGHNGTVQAAV